MLRRSALIMFPGENGKEFLQKIETPDPEFYKIIENELRKPQFIIYKLQVGIYDCITNLFQTPRAAYNASAGCIEGAKVCFILEYELAADKLIKICGASSVLVLRKSDQSSLPFHQFVEPFNIDLTAFPELYEELSQDMPTEEKEEKPRTTLDNSQYLDLVAEIATWRQEKNFHGSLDALLKKLQNEKKDTRTADRIAKATVTMLQNLKKPGDYFKTSEEERAAKIRIVERYELQCKGISRWIEFSKLVGTVILGAVGFVVGAVIGGTIGVLAGSWAGPGAALTGIAGALLGGCKGAGLAVAGSAVGVGALTSIVSCHLLFKRNRSFDQEVDNVCNKSTSLPALTG